MENNIENSYEAIHQYCKNTIDAYWFTTIFAKLFGKKSVILLDQKLITLSKWRGTIYFIDFKNLDEVDSEQN